MAKTQSGFKTTNAMIDYEQKKIVETTKEGVNVFYIDKILKEWDGIEGISLTISLNKDVIPDETVY